MLQEERDKLIHEIRNLGGLPPSSLVDFVENARSVAKNFLAEYNELYAYCNNGSKPGKFTSA